MAPSRRILSIVGLLAMTILQIGAATKLAPLPPAPERLQPIQQYPQPIQQQHETSNREISYGTKQVQQQSIKTASEEPGFGWPSTANQQQTYSRQVVFEGPKAALGTKSIKSFLPQKTFPEFAMVCPEATSLLTKIKASLQQLIDKSPLKKLASKKPVAIPTKQIPIATTKVIRVAPYIVEEPVRQLVPVVSPPLEVFDPVAKFGKFKQLLSADKFVRTYYQPPLQLNHAQQQQFRENQQQQQIVQQQHEQDYKAIEQQQEQNTLKQIEQEQQQTSFKQSEQQQQQEEFLDEEFKQVSTGVKQRETEQQQVRE